MSTLEANAGAALTRNLLIVHTAEQRDVGDWEAVRERIVRAAPDIEVRIGANGSRQPVTARWQVTRPSLVFAIGLLREYQPRGGKVFAGRLMGKREQLHRLQRLNLPVPKTLHYSDRTEADPEAWGDRVVVKPDFGVNGAGMQLVRTEDLKARYSELTIRGQRPMIVQEYINADIDGRPRGSRVMTLFGSPIHAETHEWKSRREIDAAGSSGVLLLPSNHAGVGRDRTLSVDPDMMELAQRAYTAFPECATLVVDMIRERSSGTPYILDVNPGNSTWPFSAANSAGYAPEYRRAMYEQFGVLDRTAQLLIEKTRREAS